jgi:CshA-type fibril repeat protein
MTFIPEPNFTGTPAPVSYQVTDSMGGKATSTYTPTVIAPPVVRPDTTTAGWNVTQSMNVVDGVTTRGSFDESLNTGDSAGTGTTLAAGSVRLCAPTDTAPNCNIDGSGSVVIANQGTYTLDPATGIVTFDPLPTFTGTATPVTYSVTDALGQKSSTTYTPTVTAPPVPTATPDTVELIPGQSKVFSSIFDGQTGDNDPALATKGAGAPDLTNSTVCIIDPATSVCDTDGIVTIPGQGTYTLNPTTGIVTYAALSTATPGAKTPVTYKITDGLGRSVTSTLTPTITPLPVANPDFSTGVQGAIQTLSPVGNDRPGGGASSELFPDKRTQIPSGVFLCAANEPPPDCAASSVIVNDPVTGDVLGVLTVADSGLVTFTPEPDFIGTTPAIGYQIPDNLGQKAYSTITITVLPPPAPSAVIDTGSAEYNKPVTLKPWINDAAGAVPAGSSAPAPKLIATSIRLCDDNSTFVAMSGASADCTAMKVKTIEGTYEVNATTGEVVFTPVDGFIGTVKYPPKYQIWTDWSGPGGAKSATSFLVPTIAPPGAPAAEVDVTKTKPGTSVVLNPVGNDIPGTAVLDPTSIRLCGSDEISPECTLMKATTLDGTYVVNPTTGEVTFTPRAGFTGEATIPYIIKDAMGMIAASHLIITVEDIEIVPVVAKTPVVLAKTGGARPDLLLLLGLVAIAGAGGLRVLSRRS